MIAGCIAGQVGEGNLERVISSAALRLRWLLVLTCVNVTFAVTGCVAPGSNVPLEPDDVKRAEQIVTREARLQDFDRFRVKGGLGIWNDQVSHSARIDWQQREERFDIALTGPFGVGSVRLTRDEDGARLQRGDAEPFSDASADRLLQGVLGLEAAVPIDQLALWIRGLPGDAEHVTRDQQGRLDSLRWRDASGASWQARILDYTRVAELDLPSLVSARGAGYALRLKLRDWTDSGDAESTDDSLEVTPASATGNPNDKRRLIIPGR